MRWKAQWLRCLCVPWGGCRLLAAADRQQRSFSQVSFSISISYCILESDETLLACAGRISSSVGWSHAKSAIVKRSSAIGWASARRSSHQCRLAVLASSSALPAANLPQGPQSRLAHAFLGFMAVVWQKLTAAVQVASQQVCATIHR